jgi:phosphatidylglycerophosphate synthase
MSDAHSARPDPAGGRPRETYRDTVRRLASAQKSTRGGQAYSVYVNRKLGRLAAAAAYRANLTPNMVTVISAVFSAAGIAVIALVSGWPAVVAAPLLAIGYALDAADGQLARLRGGGSAAGEWLDHIIDAFKVTTLHLAVLVHLYRFTDLSAGWLLVPIGYTVVSVALFFAQLLNEQLRRNLGFGAQAASLSSASPVLHVLKLPHDYGVMCWTFVLLGAPRLFLAVYGLLFAFNAVYLALALVKWFRELRSYDRARANDGSEPSVVGSGLPRTEAGRG